MSAYDKLLAMERAMNQLIAVARTTANSPDVPGDLAIAAQKALDAWDEA